MKTFKEYAMDENTTVQEDWKSALAGGMLAASTLAGLPQDTEARQSKSPPALQITNKCNLNDLKAFILKHEGKRNTVYKDTMGYPTIGIGMNLKNDNAPDRIKAVGADYNKIINGKASLTDKQINQLFDFDVKMAIANARKFTRNFDNLDADMQKVLIDMSFNLGPDRLGGFKRFRAALDRNNYELAAKEMIKSPWYKQVKNRSKELVNIVKSLV